MEAGSSLGPYEIIERLGAGGMGEVYLARDRRLGRKAALKVVGDRLKDDPTARKDLLREARTASNLNHPHICTIYDVGDDAGQPYIGMEYVEGRPLSELVAQEGLPVETVLRYGRQLADALAYAHDNGVVHRDLKSLNVIVTPDGRVKILDFGLARQLGGSELDETMTAMTTLTGPDQIAGTLAYMAPELLRGKAADARSDIWALGVILYEMTAGQRPFRGSTGFELSSAIMKDIPAPLPASVPVGFASVVKRCLAKALAERFGHASEIRSALETLHTTTSEAGTLARPLDGRRNMPRFVTVGALTLIVGVILWWLVDQDRTARPVPTPEDVALVAVFPFKVSGVGDFVDVGEGVMDLLGMYLDEVGGLQSTDSDALMNLVRAGQHDGLAPERAAEIAATLGARLYVLGSIVLAGGQMRATATLYETEGQTTHAAKARVDGEDQILQLTDDLAKQFLVARTGGSEEAKGIDVSFEALKPYLAGRAYMRVANYTLAIEALQQSVNEDSTFAYAWYHLARAAGPSGRVALQQQANHKALDYGNQLSERHRTLLLARLASTQGDFDESQRLVKLVLDRRPDDTSAWYHLASDLLHANPLRGRSGAEARAAFGRMYELGATEEPHGLALMAAASAVGGDRAEFVSILGRIQEEWPNADFNVVLDVLLAFTSGGETDRERALSRLANASGFQILLTVVDLAIWLHEIEGVERVARLLTEPTRPDVLRARGHVQLAHVELARGRWAAANQELDRAAVLDPVTALEHRALLLNLPFVPVTTTRLESLRTELEVWDPGNASSGADLGPWVAPHASLRPELRLYLLGLTCSRLGDFACAEQKAIELERSSTAEGKDLRGLAWSLRAYIEQKRGRSDEALKMMEQARIQVARPLTHMSAFLSQEYDRFVRAELLMTLGRGEESLRWGGTAARQSLHGIVYLAPTHLRSAVICEGLGKREDAVAHYRRVVELWQNCDAVFQPLVDEAHSALARLAPQP